jgi:hypothetical protein
MSHLTFKASQAAAQYVANGLRDTERESFELHMMNCTECVDDVETWRLLAVGLAAQEPERRPTTLQSVRPANTAAVPPEPATNGRQAARPGALHRWQLAASALLATSLGLCGGWFLHSGSAGSLEDGSLELVSLAGTSRGDDCSVVRLARDARIVAARIPGASAGAGLVATRLDGRPLEAREYSVRTQPDGSWLVRLPASRILGQEVRLEAHYPAAQGEPASSEPVGCLSGLAVP